MRANTSDLYDLVHSLSGTEKAYVKKFARLHARKAESNYLKLFDAVLSQEQYDEEKLLKKFKGEKFVRQFPVAKNYLYNQILHAMTSYHNSQYAEVRKLIHHAEFLLGKGLPDQSERVINKAEKKAMQHELSGALIEINDIWRIKLATMRNDRKGMDDAISKAMNELYSLQRTIQFRKLYAQMITLYSKRSYLEKIKKQKDPLLDNELIRDPSKSISFQQKSILCQILSKHASSTGDYISAYKHLAEKIALYDQDHERIKMALPDFVGTVSNATVTCLMLNKYNEIPGLLKKLEGVVSYSSSKLQRFKIFCQLSWLWLDYFIRTASFASADKKIPEILYELNNYKKHHRSFEIAVLYLNFAVICLSAGKAREALKWLNIVYNKYSFRENQNMEGFLYLLRLVVHFELENDELIESVLRSANQFFTKKSVFYQSEKEILQFFRNTLRLNKGKMRKEAMIALRNKLSDLQNSPEEQVVLFNFDLISWLDSKINNSSFELAYKKNHHLN